MKITKSQIKELAELNNATKEKLTEFYPELFKQELQVGKWYKSIDKSNIIFNVIEIKDEVFYFYGYNVVNIYKDYDWYSLSDLGLKNGFRLATDQEVEEALIKEAKKRYGEDWENVKIEKDAKDLFNNTSGSAVNYGCYGVTYTCNELWNRNGRLFYHGKWAEVVTKEITLDNGYVLTENDINKIKAEL